MERKTEASKTADRTAVAEALDIAKIYLLLGGFYILFSDQIVAYLFTDTATVTKIQTFKGWFYVIITTVVLYGTIKRTLKDTYQRERKISETKQELETAYEELIASNEEITSQFMKAEQDNHFLQALHDITLGIMNRLELSQLLKAIISRSCSLMGTDHSYIYLVNQEKGVLELTYSSGHYEKKIGLVLHKGEGLSGRVWETGNTAVTDDLSVWEGRSPRYDYSGLRSAIAVPLCNEGRVIGTIGIACNQAKRLFTEREIRVMEQFAELASIAIFNAGLYSQVQQELARRRNIEARNDFLHTVALQVLSGIPIRDILRFVCDELDKIFQVRSVWVCTFEKGRLSVISQSSSEQTDELTPAQLDRIAAELPAAEAGQVLKLKDCPAELVFPMENEGKMMGVLMLRQSEAGGWDEIRTTEFKTLVHQVVIALSAAFDRRRLNLLTKALESAANAVVIADASGIIQWVNPTYTGLTGYRQEEALNRHLLQDFERYEESFVNSVWQRLARGHVWQGEIISQRKDGSTYLEEITITPVVREENQIANFIAIKQDISIRRQAEGEIMEARAMVFRTERLASIGTMAAGIAHEINQPLNSLKVIADGMVFWLSRGKQFEETKIRDSFEKISRQAERIDGIIKHLRAFVRSDGAPRPEPSDLNQAVQGALELIGNQLRKNRIEVREVLSHGLPPVLGNLNRLEEVLINLLINSMHALLISTRQEKLITIETLLEKDRIILQVTDNGTGIPEEIREKIFDPFFSTKPVGEGMGIGLSIVHAIVTSFGGEVSVANNQFGGATFSLRFKCCESEAENSSLSRL